MYNKFIMRSKGMGYTNDVCMHGGFSTTTFKCSNIIRSVTPPYIHQLHTLSLLGMVGWDTNSASLLGKVLLIFVGARLHTQDKFI